MRLLAVEDWEGCGGTDENDELNEEPSSVLREFALVGSLQGGDALAKVCSGGTLCVGLESGGGVGDERSRRRVEGGAERSFWVWPTDGQRGLLLESGMAPPSAKVCGEDTIGVSQT